MTYEDYWALKWGALEDRWSFSGLEKGVLYPLADPAIPWNGLISIAETEVNAASSTYYVDGAAYFVESVTGTFNGTLQAYTYPTILDKPPAPCGLSYQTLATRGSETRKQIHILYNALLTPAASSFTTIGASPSASTFGWDISTIPEVSSDPADFTPTAHVIIEESETNKYLFQKLEAILYGTATSSARLPLLPELEELFDEWVTLRISLLSDGRWSAEWLGEGPDEAIRMVSAEEFEITWPSALPIDSTSYNISSL